MLKVGLTGGYASGKSLVAKHLEGLGCHLIYADALGHQTLFPSGKAYQPVLETFGHEILNADLTINRRKLAAIVFNNPGQLAKLNALVHPAVFEIEQNLINHLGTQNPAAIIVIEAAILIETGRFRQLDKLIVTTCPLETQIARGMSRDHITRAEALGRIERQLPDAERLQHAHYIIHTGGEIAETLAQTENVYSHLRQ